MKPEFAFREIVASALMILFAYTLVRNPHDQTIIGALLTGFAGAWGFYLGGSKVGSDTAAKNADTVAAQAQAATDTASTGPVPKDAEEGAEQVADAAGKKRDQIKDKAK